MGVTTRQILYVGTDIASNKINKCYTIHNYTVSNDHLILDQNKEKEGM